MSTSPVPGLQTSGLGGAVKIRTLSYAGCPESPVAWEANQILHPRIQPGVVCESQTVDLIHCAMRLTYVVVRILTAPAAGFLVSVLCCVVPHLHLPWRRLDGGAPEGSRPRSPRPEICCSLRCGHSFQCSPYE